MGFNLFKKMMKRTKADGADKEPQKNPGKNYRYHVDYEANFTDADLRGADFTCATLGTEWRASTFRNAKLQGAIFKEATLVDVNFHDADLCGADLRGANLTGVYCNEKTNLTGAIVDKATIIDIEREELSKAIGGDELVSLVRRERLSEDGLAVSSEESDRETQQRGHSREWQDYVRGGEPSSPANANDVKKTPESYSKRCEAEKNRASSSNSHTLAG